MKPFGVAAVYGSHLATGNGELDVLNGVHATFSAWHTVTSTAATHHQAIIRL